MIESNIVTIKEECIKHFPFYSLFMLFIYLSFYYIFPESNYSSIELNTKYSYQIYRYYTYSLLHANVMHLIINLYTWIVFASIVEYDSGSIRSFGIHLSSIIGGSFATGWQSRITNVPTKVIGASGGIYGMLSSIISDLILNWNEFSKYKKFVYISILTTTITSDIVTNIVYYNPKISYSAHIGGFINGIFGGLILSRNRKIDKWEKKMQIGIGITIAAVSISSFFNLLFINY
jgi:membrane associated rhomboid family serine protease